MGRMLQKKKNRSSIPRAKLKPRSKKKMNLKSNPIIAANWNQKETLSQNYRRLGLVSKLNARTGGIEKRSSAALHSASEKERDKDPLAIANKNSMSLVPGLARIERHPETGAILRVLGDGADEERKKGKREWNGRTLRDELDGFVGVDNGEGRERVGQHDLPAVDAGAFGGGEGVVPELLLQAATTGTRKRPRKQSRREEEWVGRLVERYGDDVSAMARDKKLNPMQQSEGDIGRRVRMWKDQRRRGGGNEE
ncbi:MAG: hypothetical protein Q9211_004789 [Gyalolechia sp. 1 TL-2023]